MKHLESYEQIAYFEWLARKWPKVYELSTANAAGGKRNAREAARLKREGIKAGWPDIFIALPVENYHALFIELKAPKGRPTKKQIEVIEQLNSHSYCAGVCYGWEQAMEATHNYIHGHVLYSHPNWVFDKPDTSKPYG